MRIDFIASEDVHRALGCIGRTEDIRFSPAGDRLAIAGFNSDLILIASVRIDWKAGDPRIEVSKMIELRSDDLARPHGVDWIDENSLAVANRHGGLALFDLTDLRAGSHRRSAARVLGRDPADLVNTPGSIACADVGLGLVELLVCNNIVGNVARLLLDRRAGDRLVASEIIVRDGLFVPDGIAFSGSREWIAISNHGREAILLFRNDPDFGLEARPAAELTGVRYPHGIRFSPGGNQIFVADAGSPFVAIFERQGGWAGPTAPAAFIRIVDDDLFERGRTRPEEGGAKGIDISADGRLLAATLHGQPLSFFDLSAVADKSAPEEPAEDEAERARAAVLRYFSAAGRHTAEAVRATRIASEFELVLFKDSRSWRFTKPLRRAMAALRKTRPHWLRRRDARLKAPGKR